MKGRVHWTVGLTSVMITMLCFSAWAVPGFIDYQGKLTDDVGKSLDGIYTAHFYLYDALSSGTLLWDEQQSVVVTDGIYNVQLGSVSPLDSNVFAGDEVYLEVVIYNAATSTWEKLSPRQRLTATAYAFQAENAHALEGYGSADFAPVVHGHSGDDITSGTVDEARIDPDIARDAEITWGNLSGIPSDISDGDQVGITTETDPMVDPSVKDGVSWAELSGIPSGFADGVDHAGITIENDPQVGNISLNYVPKWNGSALVQGSIYDNGKVGIGTTEPQDKLEVSGGMVTLDSGPENSLAGMRIRENGDMRWTLLYRTWQGDNLHIYDEVSNKSAITFESGTGRIGIGTTSPGAHLEVGDTARIMGSTWPATGEGLELAYNPTLNRGYIQAYSRDTQTWGNLYLGEGKVGIGETSPSAKLEVYTPSGKAVYGKARGGPNLLGYGVYGEGNFASGYGVYGIHTFSGNYGFLGGSEYAVYGNGNIRFENGTVSMSVLEITGGADLSEQFEIRESEEGSKPVPGMVVSIDPENPGHLAVSTEPYDRRVAGIVSGAGGIKPGMMMGQKGSKANGSNAVALTGRVYCWADASHGPIQPGDLLTTSSTLGHAMKVTDYSRAQGAILGKAMTSLSEDRGLVLVLVTLQ